MTKIIKHITMATISLVILDCIVGICCQSLMYFNHGKLYYKLFDYSEKHFKAAIKNNNYYDFFQAEFYDSTTGWNSPRTRHLSSQGCDNVWQADYDENGSRISTLPKKNNTYEIVCLGDSFTHGNEVENEHSYPASLEKMSNFSVGNFGVGGFDTVQSVLQMKNIIAKQIIPKVAILGISYDNGRRNINSLRPVYTNSSDIYEYFALKPYFDGHGLNTAAVEANTTLDSYMQHAITAFKNDYWAKPRLEFPFILSFIRAITTQNAKFIFIQKINKALGKPIYSHDFQNKDITDSFYFCINMFLSLCANHNIYPIVIFFPTDSQDITSPNSLIDTLKAKHNFGLFLNFGNAKINWNSYVNHDGCHPTQEGYYQMAKYIYEHMPKSNISK